MLSNKIKPLREEVVLCDGIEERTPKVEKDIKEFEENNGKEVSKNELIK